jgi:hypothetical protein
VRGRARLALAGAAALAACGRGAPALDTSCPAGGSAPRLVLAGMAERGIPGPPETTRVGVGGDTILVGWKNLLSGRQLTLSCAYRREADGWRLLHARLDEGTHSLLVAGEEDPPALVYRDAEGRLLDVVPVRPSTRDE